MSVSPRDIVVMKRSGEIVMKKEERKFAHSLKDHLIALQEALKTWNKPKAKEVSYHLKSTAGGFGWPVVGEAAGLLYLALEFDNSSPELFKICSLFLNKIMPFAAVDNRARCEESIALLKSMQKELEALID